MIEYGGLWKRVWARLIDVALLLPFGLLNIWFWYESSHLAMVWAIVMSCITPTYLILLHGLCGQSLGKMLTGLKVEEVGAARLSWRGALVRFSPATVFHIASGAGLMYAIHSLPEGALVSATYMQKCRLVISHTPWWGHWCSRF